jgi:hypothetical protein
VLDAASGLLSSIPATTTVKKTTRVSSPTLASEEKPYEEITIDNGHPRVSITDSRNLL